LQYRITNYRHPHHHFRHRHHRFRHQQNTHQVYYRFTLQRAIARYLLIGTFIVNVTWHLALLAVGKYFYLVETDQRWSCSHLKFMLFQEKRGAVRTDQHYSVVGLLTSAATFFPVWRKALESARIFKRRSKERSEMCSRCSFGKKFDCTHQSAF
jgi:hypothetical protein